MSPFQVEILRMNEPELQASIADFIRSEFWYTMPATSKYRGSTITKTGTTEHDVCSGECPETP